MMATGTVKKFNEAKGFGFITPSDGGRDLHVVTSAMKAGSSGTLKEGQRVEYTPDEGPKGPLARDVSILSEEVPMTRKPGSSSGGCCEGAKKSGIGGTTVAAGADSAVHHSEGCNG